MKSSKTNPKADRVPLLLKFKRAQSPSQLNYWYDEQSRLNVAMARGRVFPVLDIDPVLSMLKSQQVTEGED